MMAVRGVTLRTRLTATYAAAILITLGFTGAAVWWSASVAYRESLDQALTARAVGMLGALEDGDGSGLQEPDRPRSEVFAAIISPDGRIIDTSTGFPVGLPVPQTTGAGEVSIGSTRYAVQVRRSEAGPRLLVGASLTPIADRLDDLTRVLLVIGAGGALCSVIAGWMLAGRALRPVDALTRDAGRFSTLDPGRRLADPGTDDEVGRLARTLNAMLDRIEDGIRRQDAFIAAASHDLRTPLASLLLDLELAGSTQSDDPSLRVSIAAAHADVVRLVELANALLDLSALRSPEDNLVRTATSLGAIVDDVFRRLRPLAETHGITVVTEVEDAPLVADRIRLGQALGNLLANAILHGGDNHEIRVVAAMDRRTPGRSIAELAVHDQGPGLPPDIVEGPIQAFRRGPSRSGGHGLGLAIADAAARAHQGQLVLASSPGEGTWARIRIPVLESSIGRESARDVSPRWAPADRGRRGARRP